MKGDLFIDGYDAYNQWGVSLEPGSIANLLTAPEVKDYVTNDCPNEDGIRYSMPSGGLKYKQREVQINICITSRGDKDYLMKYRSFVDRLKTDVTEWRLGGDDDVVYRLIYKKMDSYSQIRFKTAKFVLTMIEPNPGDRKR